MMTFTQPTTVELLGLLFGLFGAIRMVQGRNGQGFLWFLLCNWCWIFFALEHGQGFLLINQIVLFLVSAYGLWVYVFGKGGRPA